MVGPWAEDTGRVLPVEPRVLEVVASVDAAVRDEVHELVSDLQDHQHPGLSAGRLRVLDAAALRRLLNP